MVIIKTKEFVLRPLRISDAEAYFEITQDKLSQKGFSRPPDNLKEARQEINGLIEESKRKLSEPLAIEINGEYAGSVITECQNWNPKDHRGRMHYWLHPKFRGRGIVTKAVKIMAQYGFKKYKWAKIIAQCRSSNKGSIGVLKRAGFKLEGVLKKDAIKNGKYIDNLVWAKMNPKIGRTAFPHP